MSVRRCAGIVATNDTARAYQSLELEFDIIGLPSSELYKAPIAMSARLTSSTPSGGSGDCGGKGAPTG